MELDTVSLTRVRNGLLRRYHQRTGEAASGLDAKGRNGRSLADRAERVLVWNTRPKSLECSTEKWNEFLAA